MVQLDIYYYSGLITIYLVLIDPNFQEPHTYFQDLLEGYLWSWKFAALASPIELVRGVSYPALSQSIYELPGSYAPPYRGNSESLLGRDGMQLHTLR